MKGKRIGWGGEGGGVEVVRNIETRVRDKYDDDTKNGFLVRF